MIHVINNPLVSILIASYNGEKYIEESIQSVLNQTYSNFELIISDDCSVDNTVNIAHSFMSIDPRIKLFINDKNLGDYPNRNKAASYAKGMYIKYLDQDDIMYSHCLEVMVNSMEENPEASFGIQSTKREDVHPYPIFISGSNAIREHYLHGGLFLAGPTGAIIRKSCFDEIGGFSGRRFLGDTELWLKLASSFSLVKFQPALIWWRVHDEQESQYQKKYFSVVIARYKLDKHFLDINRTSFSNSEFNWTNKKLNRRFIVNSYKTIISTDKKTEVLKQFFGVKLSFVDFMKAIFHK